MEILTFFLSNFIFILNSILITVFKAHNNKEYRKDIEYNKNELEYLKLVSKDPKDCRNILIQ